ncbi:Type VI secretion protein [Citrobacter sedlakii]|uniref:hypothetical protein n=1 Tax=Citrobacter sedlakii TaxID=67826 RepID=UPI001BAB6E01|nr:hypothetical protein [Citrobacter sedlakii]QUC31640.1 hypothetical protein JY391_07890 [Citrobacter sedlakii]
MPVDLTCIPARVENCRTPSTRRWLVFLLALLTGNGLITAWLWPAGVSTHIPLFWLCFPGGAIVIWLALVIVRSTIFLAPVFGNGGWNDARERDLAQEIRRGQRSLIVLAQAAQLPHVVVSGALSGQLLIPDGISIPPVADATGQNVIHQAQFGDASLARMDRLKARLQALLSDGRVLSALRGLPQQSSLAIALLTGPEDPVTREQQQMSEQIIREITGLSLHLSFIEGTGPDILDRWLDEPGLMQTLLVLAVNLVEGGTDGTGEAAVALLLQRTDDLMKESVVSVHRPELTHPEQGITYALQQALLWGMTTPDAVRQIWLTGMGIENKADGLFSDAGIRFPGAGQPCDIDLYTGQTGCASHWLAMVVAAENLITTSSPQLLMSVAGENQAPWFMVIRSPAKPV